MNMIRRSGCVALASAAALAVAHEAGGQQADSSSPQARARAIAAAHPEAAQARVLARSSGGRDIPLLRIAGPGETDPDARPALLIVAGVSPMHLAGTETAFGVAQALAAQANEALADATVYIVPVLNADAQAVIQAGEGPRRLIDRTFAPVDDDHDGRVDEDRPVDLNGDGVITMMRLLDPPPGIEATLTTDPDDPRLLRPARPELGERNRYALFVEGVDGDGDGAIGEDGAGGVDLNLNFPARWPEFSVGSGAHQLDQPESWALARWMLDRPNIAAVLVFGPHDNLASAQREGQYDQTNRVPRQLETGDKAYHDEIVKIFKDITGMTGAPSREFDGSFALWAYTHFGVPTFATPVWVRPDLIERDGEADESAQASAPQPQEQREERIGGMTLNQMRAMVRQFQSASESERAAMIERFRSLPQAAQQRIMQLAQGQEAGEGGGQPPRRAQRGRRAGGSDSDDAKWLAYSDEQRNGAGFVEWTPFDHPALGRVEIGGFVPGFRLNPPDDELPRLIDEQTRFAIALIKRLPRLRVAEPYVERVGARLWRVAARVVNDGLLPTTSAMGVKTRRITPVVMQLDARGATLLAGEPQQRQASVNGSGAEARGEWLVSAPEGTSVEVVIRASALGEERIRIPLREAASDEENG